MSNRANDATVLHWTKTSSLPNAWRMDRVQDAVERRQCLFLPIQTTPGDWNSNGRSKLLASVPIIITQVAVNRRTASYAIHIPEHFTRFFRTRYPDVYLMHVNPFRTDGPHSLLLSCAFRCSLCKNINNLVLLILQSLDIQIIGSHSKFLSLDWYFTY